MPSSSGCGTGSPISRCRKLPLFPRRRCNPTGRLAMISPTLSNRVTKWVKNDPGAARRGRQRVRPRDVYLYALRHSYAQRHADAGVPIDTLQKLMDHRTTATTQIYYRVDVVAQARSDRAASRR